MLAWRISLLAAAVVLSLCGASGEAEAYSANKVWFEFRPSGIYRVVVNYTVPEMKEFREAYVEFTSRKAAESFFTPASVTLVFVI